MDETAQKRIRFINSEYETLFFVDDGGEIEIRDDGVWEKRKCRYIDDYHTKVGGCDYHICEFAEKRESLNQPYRPVFKTTGLPVMVKEITDAFINRDKREETRQALAKDYEAAAECFRRKVKGEDGAFKAGFLNTFLDGYFYALELVRKAEAADA
jgi:hypothetical protein